VKVLVVEPDVATRAVLVELLRARGLRHVVAEDLETAWDLWQRGSFPLLILDWDRFDGAELCWRVRAAPGGEDPFILALVEQASPEGLLAVLNAGANDFLTDPRHIAVLRARLAVAE